MTKRASTQPSVASLVFVLTLYHSLVRVGVLTWACSSISRRSPRFTSARSSAATAVDERILSLGALTIPSSIFESEGSKPHAATNTLASATAQHTVTRLIDVVAFCMRWFDLIETIRAALGMSSNDGWREEGKRRWAVLFSIF